MSGAREVGGLGETQKTRELPWNPVLKQWVVTEDD